MSRWFDLEITNRSSKAEEAARILKERIHDIPVLELEFALCHLHIVFNDGHVEGYMLQMDASVDQKVRVDISAGCRRDFIAGVGELLKRFMSASDPSELELGSWAFAPRHPMRVHYMPGHFGNSFEVCWSGEMNRYLEDLALAGASGYGDWFDPNDMPDPYRSHVFHSTSMFLWRRKKEWMTYSQRLGLDNVLVVTPNIGFVDQMRPEWVGVRDHELRVQGQVLCPSKQEARQVIIQNHRNLFTDLHASGIQLDKLVCVPYDDGGCACHACQPYYPVFLKLVQEIVGVAREYYPELKIDICGWWTSEEERQQLREFIDGPAREWFSCFQYSATYGVYALPDIRPQIGDMRLGSFLHIGFSNDRRDVYIKTGIHSAPDRLQSVIRSFDAQQCQGFMTYNESFGDHYNAFVASQLGWNPSASVREITVFYCHLILGLRGEHASRMTEVLMDMQFLDSARAREWKRILVDLEPHIRVHRVQPWAFAHIRLKAELMYLDHEIETYLNKGNQVGADGRIRDGAQADGDAAESESIFHPVLPLMQKRLELSEQLWRQVYGLGVLRHILIPELMLPAWHKEYLDQTSVSVDHIRSGTMSSEA